MNLILAGMQKAGAPDLQANAEAVAGNAGNIGFGAVHPVRGSTHLGHHGAGDGARLKRTPEAVAKVPRKLDCHAKQAFAAHFAPLVEAVFGQKIVGCEADYGVRGLILPDDPGGLFFRCAKSKMNERVGSPLSVEIGAPRRFESQPAVKPHGPGVLFVDVRG